MYSNDDFLSSIEQAAAFLCQQGRSDLVKSVLLKHHAKSIDDLDTDNFEDVFNELFTYEADLK